MEPKVLNPSSTSNLSDDTGFSCNTARSLYPPVLTPRSILPQPQCQPQHQPQPNLNVNANLDHKTGVMTLPLVPTSSWLESQEEAEPYVWPSFPS